MASTEADESKISTRPLPDFTANPEFWPVLPALEAWQDTRDTVHMWTQIVGKVRLALNPLINHWWEVPLYVSPRGLATSSIPYARGIFEVEFDFLADRVLIQTSEGADSITREAYSHEVISAGFWPGGGDIKGAAFYAYAAPEPLGFAETPVRPASAFYHPQMHEFILMYDDVRQSGSPKTTLLDFLQSTYEAGANSAKWNRAELERAA